MMVGRYVYEGENEDTVADPEEQAPSQRRLITQPYDLVVESLLDQISSRTLHLRPISDRPSFQRRYVWTDKLASRLIESVLLNVPIPPCYLSQNDDYELDVIDGQQRIYSIYRYLNNQFRLSDLEILKEFNGSRFFELPLREQRKLQTYTVRCVVITNDSDPEIRFDVFERLNTNTMPLNAQELRNCIYRGALIDLVNKLADYKPWLTILNRKEPDKRMRGEELALRFFSFYIRKVDSYRTPQKHWLNETAQQGQHLSEIQVTELEQKWKDTLNKCLSIFAPNECFRRLPLDRPKMVMNRALMDLTMLSIVDIPKEQILQIAPEFRERYMALLKNEEFDDLITRAIDHKSRTLRRFVMWELHVTSNLW